MPGQAAGQLTVLSITGWCRNGSTIIGNILNEVPGFTHVGELAFLWRNAAGKGANRRCGCGAELTQCSYWSKVLELTNPDDVPLDSYADTVIARQRACVRNRHTWRVLARGLDNPLIREHATLMTATYQAIAELMDARVIVDSSKIGGEAALLARLDRITPYYVHLVRDPRAVALSWRNEKDYVYRLPARKSTAYWSGFNLASRAIARHYPRRSMLLRYEDFIADPPAAIGRLLEFCGAAGERNPLRGRNVELHTNHTVTGNPDRFNTGPTAIRDHDYPWQRDLPAPSKLATLALSWPLLRSYGYPYSGTRPAGR